MLHHIQLILSCSLDDRSVDFGAMVICLCNEAVHEPALNLSTVKPNRLEMSETEPSHEVHEELIPLWQYISNSSMILSEIIGMRYRCIRTLPLCRPRVPNHHLLVGGLHSHLTKALEIIWAELIVSTLNAGNAAGCGVNPPSNFSAATRLTPIWAWLMDSYYCHNCECIIQVQHSWITPLGVMAMHVLWSQKSLLHYDLTLALQRKAQAYPRSLIQSSVPHTIPSLVPHPFSKSQ